ncbi:MAG: aminotransferase class I/II-fold pyridoxal phosphate-dependent enzyme [Eubacteriales bacterium]|nr:aminotransferase class I/II-fold pyridoxal phosphate-dependent enzyme [Eubacteriales bacterium]
MIEKREGEGVLELALDYAKIQAQAPLFKRLIEVSERDVKGFHMPGNRGGRAFPPGFRTGWSSLETTELEASGDVLSGSGAVAAAAARAAAFAGSAASLFITQGSSTGLMTSLAILRHFSKRVLLPRTVHAAVIRGLALLDMEAVFLPLEEQPGQQLPQIDITNSLALIEEQKGPVCLLLTRPDYYGSVVDITELVKALRKSGGLLAVDEAHGAHLSLGAAEFPASAISEGADIVCQSAHKTLAALAPAALIQIGQRAEAEFKLTELARRELRLFHSTSPSFPIAASIDWARAYLELYGLAQVEQLTVALTDFARALPADLKVLNPRLGAGESELRAFDLLHLLIEFPYYATPAHWSKLLLEAGLEAELVSFNQALFLLAPDSSRADLAELAKRLARFSEMAKLRRPDLESQTKAQKLAKEVFSSYTELPERGLSLRRSRLEGEVEVIDLEAASGRIVADLIAPYPPGIPLLWPGERLSPRLLRLISQCLDSGLDLLGIDQRSLAVLKS